MDAEHWRQLKSDARALSLIQAGLTGKASYNLKDVYIYPDMAKYKKINGLNCG